VGIWKNMKIKYCNIPDAQEYDPVFTHGGNKIIMPQFYDLMPEDDDLELSIDDLINGMIEAVHRHHDAGLVHGDLNIGNFMINRVGNRVVLIDFETTRKHYNDKEDIKRDLYQTAVSIIKVYNNLFEKKEEEDIEEYKLKNRAELETRYEKEVKITNRFLKLNKIGFEDRWETIKRVKEAILKLLGDRN